MHKQKLVHRDIKPSNIMVSLKEEGAATAKIIDLGLAGAVSEPDALVHRIISGRHTVGFKRVWMLGVSEERIRCDT